MRLLAMVLLSLVLLTYPAGGQAEPDIVACGAILIDADSGRALYERNADEPLPMASTTKIMTALLVLENANPDDVVTVGANASGVPGTSIYLSAGERLTVRDLLLGLMLRSGNDAAVALAEHVGGDVETFAAMMNERADSLGADARFVNPHGLDADGHEASARAMALIARAALSRSDFRTLASTQRATIPWAGNAYQRVLQTKNRLLWEYDGATGVKTGYTGRAGRCLVFSAERDGVRLVGAVLGCGTWFDSARTLLDWGFDRYRRVTPLARGDPAGALDMEGRKVPVRASEPLSFVLGEGEDYEVLVVPLQNLSLPVSEGQTVASAYAISRGESLAQIFLEADADVESRNFGRALTRTLSLWPCRAA